MAPMPSAASLGRLCQLLFCLFLFPNFKLYDYELPVFSWKNNAFSYFCAIVHDVISSTPFLHLTSEDSAQGVTHPRQPLCKAQLNHTPPPGRKSSSARQCAEGIFLAMYTLVASWYCCSLRERTITYYCDHIACWLPSTGLKQMGIYQIEQNWVNPKEPFLYLTSTRWHYFILNGAHKKKKKNQEEVQRRCSVYLYTHVHAYVSV